MKVSFLAPTLGNRPNEIVRLLDSLRIQTNKNFEIILVIQDNHDKIKKICLEYKDIEIIIVNSNCRGLSVNRNIGMSYCQGDIIVLSDDDCWYPNYVVEHTIKYFENNKIDVLLTQIYDQFSSRYYKKYKEKAFVVSSKYELLSKSSIEIAFSRWIMEKIKFDELFGLGAELICCEEVDFLIRAYIAHARIMYIPKISVFHLIKKTNSDKKQIIAKGALYAKNFNICIGIGVCLRDLIIKGENNFIPFFIGYNRYKHIVKNKVK